MLDYFFKNFSEHSAKSNDEAYEKTRMYDEKPEQVILIHVNLVILLSRDAKSLD